MRSSSSVLLEDKKTVLEELRTRAGRDDIMMDLAFRVSVQKGNP